MASEEPDDEGLRRDFSRWEDKRAPAVANGRAGTSYGNPVIRRDNPVPVGERRSPLGSACALRKAAP
jgi:hypothetical protein